MREIKNILDDIAAKKAIKILYACETGSRAWGFPSPDSDYDIRFIYMHERDWYLSLSGRKDTIEHMEGELDITGWDLKKSLLLLSRSNAPLIERFQSPIPYYEDNDFRKVFSELIRQHYSPTAVFYHHYSLAQKFWEELKEKEEIKLKSFFYLVRSLLSCNWVSKDASVLPMDIEGLMTLIEPGRREQLRSLVRLKAGVGEKYLHQRDESLNEWVRELFNLLENSKSNLGVSKGDHSSLNEFFIKMINTHAHG